MDVSINAKVEKALREALHDLARIDAGQAPASLAALDEQGRTEVGGLALTVTAYIVIDVCGAQWPTQSSVERIARTLATKTTTAKRLRLDPEKVHAYLSRTVFGRERLEDVLPDEPESALLPVIVAGEALAVYAPKGMGMWDYLDQVEAGIEEASALEARALPGAVMRAYMRGPAD